MVLITMKTTCGQINLSFQDVGGVGISNPRRCHRAELMMAFSHKTPARAYFQIGLHQEIKSRKL